MELVSRAFVGDILGRRAEREKTHSLLVLGPALYSEVMAHDAGFEKLGTGVVVLNPQRPGATTTSRMCSNATCAEFLRAGGLRMALGAFSSATYREPTPEERRVMLERSPELLPKDSPATVATVGAQRLAFYALEGSVVWVELISKPAMETFEPSDGAPPSEVSKAIASTKCLKLDSVQLDQAEEVFLEQTTGDSLGNGVAEVVHELDKLLLERKSDAAGSWTLRVTFGSRGISIVAAPPHAGVEPIVLDLLGRRLLNHGPVSLGAQLSLTLQLTLRACPR